jgi:hypothetical protein
MSGGSTSGLRSRHLGLVRLPDVDTTILGMFGIGQGAYLVKKGVEGNAPTPTPPSMSPLGGKPSGAPINSPQL